LRVPCDSDTFEAFSVAAGIPVLSYPVAIHKCAPCPYPAEPPFDPGEAYPESPFPGRIDPGNRVYGMVRNALLRLGLDRDRAGTPDWNPLHGLVRPGDTVFVKPNMIAHRHALRPEEWECVITHGSVLRAVLDYVFLALDGRGAILVGDAPQTDSRFDAISEHMGLAALRQLYLDRDLKIEIIDLRDEYWVEKDGIYVEKVPLSGDPRGGVSADLGAHSMFAELDGRGYTYYGAYYDTEETNRHHRDGRHEYAISATPLQADVFISVPKLKTHKKCGITVNLKGLVGINADKNWLPHYRIGSPAEGGDQFPDGGIKGRLENAVVLTAKRFLRGNHPLPVLLARKLKRTGYRWFGGTEEVVRSGNWHGNDTVWRMSLDLNRILIHAAPDGTLTPDTRPPKRFFSVVDGVVGMEGNGPVAGEAAPSGVIVAGDNPVAVDAVCACLMGFDCRKLPLIHQALAPHPFPLFSGTYDDIEVQTNHPPWRRPPPAWPGCADPPFRPHFGWRGHMEAEPSPHDS
jgi:uncharacterized protein (DUF362 family)